MHILNNLSLNDIEGSEIATLPLALTANLKKLKMSSLEEMLRVFNDAKARNNYIDVKKDFRVSASHLLEQRLITMNDYVAIFGGHAINHLSINAAGQFYSLDTCQESTSLISAYSRAKYGSIEDIRYLARTVISMLSEALDCPESHWRRLFETAKSNGDNVVMMTTGWRNVPSTANVLYEIVVEHINIKLTYLGLPTIVNVKLPRIAPPCENYASLTTEEREKVNLVHDHVIPGKNFYSCSGVHVIFGDDVLVTGATADKIFFESIRNGAKTFQSIYPIAIDPRVALRDAAIEEKLNTVVVKGELDDVIANILLNLDYQPILRTLRLLFSKCNYAALPDFLSRVPSETWLRLYISALGNEFLQQQDCVASLELLRKHLHHTGILNSEGMIASI